MNLKKTFILNLALCLVGALLASELLTRYILYPTVPITRLSFRIWLAQKKKQVVSLPQRMPRLVPVKAPQLPPPIVYQPEKSPPTKTPFPEKPSPPPKVTPTPVPSPTKSPLPLPSSSPPPGPSPLPSPSPTPLPSPSPPPPPPGENQKAKDLVRVINEERAKQSLNGLGTPNLLMQAAQIYVGDLASIHKCGHEVPGKGFLWDYAKRLGYQGTPIGEVIACGANNASQAVNMWMDDAPHRDCIMHPSAGSIGAGVSGNYWLAGIYY